MGSDRADATSALDEPVDSAVGRTLDGRYSIESQLGVGGVGAVYRATQVMLGRSVAVKLLLDGLDPSFRARFEREAKALAGLRHPNIVAINDYGVDHDTPYLVMELLEGETLAQRLQRGPLEPEHVLELTQQLLRALAFVHEQGLVHRDLKPGNLFLEQLPDGDERLKLLDFGLAKFMGSPQSSPDEPTVTRAGHVVGTPAYMAPEQIAGDGADARTDTYSVGVLLFQMLTGRVPFVGEPVEQLKAHLVTVAPTLEQVCPGLRPQPALSEFVARALNKPRDARFQSAADMLEALESVPQPWLREGSSRALADLSAATTLLQDSADAGRPARTTDPSARGGARRTWMPIAIFVCAVGTAIGVRWVRTLQDAPSAHDGAARAAASPRAAEPKEKLPVQPEAAHDEHMVISADEVAEAEDDTAANAAAAAPAATADATAQPAASATPVSTTPIATAAPPRVVRVPARNPWARGTPANLRAVRKAVMNGDHGSERTITALRKYNAVSYDDPRGHLLLARMYLNRNWRTDAVTQYSLAYQLDPAARGAPEMLPDLLKLVAVGNASAEASRLVHKAYGPEALPAINSALISFRTDPGATARLQALRKSITAS
jgi:serine/threonine-protein kinase